MRQAYTRARPRKGMPIWRHILLALIVLCLAPVTVAAYVNFKGNETDAIAQGYAALAPLPTPEPLYQLGDEQAAIVLPDVLDPDDRAQTVRVATIDNSGLAGADQPTSTQQSRPKVLTIDGRPVSAGETAVIGGTAPQTRATNSPGRYIPRGQNSSAPLTRAPIAGFSRRSPFGQIPTPNANGESPMQAYAKPANPPRETRKMALIVGGLGLHPARTQRAIDELPPEVTLSFAPQTRGLQAWIDKARAKGHEVILELPMEPYNLSPEDDVPGHMLKASASPQENVRVLERTLSRAQGYMGVMNFYGEKFLDTPNAATPVFASLKETGIGFIYNGVGRADNVRRLSGDIPWTQSSAIIDLNPSAAQVQENLTALEGVAGRRDIALGIGVAQPYTLDGIIFWAQGLEERDVVLVPASYILLDQ